MLIRQTIQKKSVNIWLFFAGIALTLVAIEYVDDLLVGQSALLRTLLSVSIIGVVAYYSYDLIYYRLAEYHYKVISDEIIFEKVIGRGNHVVLYFQQSDLLTVAPYSGKGVKRRDIFCHRDQLADAVLVTFFMKGRHKRLVIAPDATLNDYLLAHAKRVNHADVTE